jgi:hypothetical protein
MVAYIQYRMKLRKLFLAQESIRKSFDEKLRKAKDKKKNNDEIEEIRTIASNENFWLQE